MPKTPLTTHPVYGHSKRRCRNGNGESKRQVMPTQRNSLPAHNFWSEEVYSRLTLSHALLTNGRGRSVYINYNGVLLPFQRSQHMFFLFHVCPPHPFRANKRETKIIKNPTAWRVPLIIPFMYPTLSSCFQAFRAANSLTLSDRFRRYIDPKHIAEPLIRVMKRLSREHIEHH